MICRHCNESFADAESYIAHLESLADAGTAHTAEEKTAYVDGINDVLRRNNNDPNRRATAKDFGIL